MSSTFPTALDPLAALQDYVNRLSYGDNQTQLLTTLVTAIAALEIKVGATGTGQQFPVGIATPVSALGFGATATEGMQLYVQDETLTIAADNVALFTPMTTAIPSGAVILSIQSNITTALTGGGTTVKAGIGLHGSDPDAYGLSAALTKNSKTNLMLAYAALAGATTIDVCACATDGAAGDTALTAGAVRVRVAYLANLSLDNA